MLQIFMNFFQLQVVHRKDRTKTEEILSLMTMIFLVLTEKYEQLSNE